MIATWHSGLMDTRMSSNMEVKHNPQAQRFEIELDGQLAVTEYNLEGNDIYFIHTEVPAGFEGRGIGSQLARTALDYSQAKGYTVHVLCSFIKAYIQNHPEYQRLTK
jgi:predicted GNAT family acetyltransferase